MMIVASFVLNMPATIVYNTCRVANRFYIIGRHYLMLIQWLKCHYDLNQSGKTTANLVYIVCRCPSGFHAGAITFGISERLSNRAGDRVNSP